jgi:ABC-type dipeptide/oligopeptide/nickel transport system ATPase subunit
LKILEVQNLKKIFGDKIIFDNINFEIKSGECLSIVGRSGCGKSTLARVIARFIPADGGKIILDKQDITNEKNLKSVYAKMQMIFQLPEDSFDPRKTLGWSIGEPLRNFNFKNIDGRIKNLLAEVGLPADFVEKYPHEVSGGQCQRAAIARAISISPKLLICDEATSALDITTQAQIVKLLRRLCTEKKLAMLFITHDFKILNKISDKIFEMNKS